METEAINARIPAGLKRAMKKYCEKEGLKVQAFLERLIQEHLEDEMDQKTIEDRANEETVPFDAVLGTLGFEP